MLRYLTNTGGIDVDSGRVEGVASLTHSSSTRHCSTSSRARRAVCPATCQSYWSYTTVYLRDTHSSQRSVFCVILQRVHPHLIEFISISWNTPDDKSDYATAHPPLSNGLVCDPFWTIFTCNITSRPHLWALADSHWLPQTLSSNTSGGAVAVLCSCNCKNWQKLTVALVVT